MKWNKGIENYMPKPIPKFITTEINANMKDFDGSLNHLTKTTITQFVNIVKKEYGQQNCVKILDVGCHRMYGLKPFLNKGYYCCGVEIMKQALESKDFVDLKHPKLRRVMCMMEDLDKVFNYQEFDVIIFNAALHHTDELQKVCHNAYGILKPEGMLLAMEPYASWLERDNKRMNEMKNIGHNDHLFQLKEYINALKTANFNKVEIIMPDYYKDIKPLGNNEVRWYKHMLSNLFKSQIGYKCLQIGFPIAYRCFSIPIIIQAKKEVYIY